MNTVVICFVQFNLGNDLRRGNVAPIVAHVYGPQTGFSLPYQTMTMCPKQPHQQQMMTNISTNPIPFVSSGFIVSPTTPVPSAAAAAAAAAVRVAAAAAEPYARSSSLRSPPLQLNSKDLSASSPV